MDRGLYGQTFVQMVRVCRFGTDHSASNNDGHRFRIAGLCRPLYAMRCTQEQLLSIYLGNIKHNMRCGRRKLSYVVLKHRNCSNKFKYRQIRL